MLGRCLSILFLLPVINSLWDRSVRQSSIRIASPYDGSRMIVAQANYSLNLFRRVSEPLESIILSPFSVTEAFGIVYLGAGGATKAEIQDVFAHGCSEDEYRTYLWSQLKEVNTANQEYTLDTANRLYYANDLKLKKQFSDLVKAEFEGQLQPTDFSRASSAAQEINGWVEEKTRSKIKNLVQPSMFSAETRLVIVNAVYFKGTWLSKFEKAMTSKEKFYITEGKEKMVDMMHKQSRFHYYADGEVQVLGLPYKGGDIEMFILLPRKRYGLEALLKTIDGNKLLSYIHGVSQKQVKVSLPKFTLEKQFDLTRVMSDLGVQQAFTRNANFTEMCSESVQISQATHKAFIEVNEEGTEAAAATVIGIMVTSVMIPDEPVSFVADHPFMFAIVKNDNLLFVGQHY